MHALDDVAAEIEYSIVENRHRRYKGKKTLEQRKVDFRARTLREEIKDALGVPPGNNRRTINFDELNKDHDIFLKYLTEVCRKEDGGLHRAVSYTSQRSSLTFLYRRYNETQPIEFSTGLSESMLGVKNLCAQAQQHGEGNIEDGDRALSWRLYEKFNEWFLIEGTPEGIFGKAFSVLCVNLAARGKSTAQVCTKHMQWHDDCLSIAFAHVKDSQDGSDPIKKLPRSIYCNPLTHSTCPLTAIFDYAVLHGDVIKNPEDSLFPGSLANQAQRFGKLVKKYVKSTKLRSKMTLVLRSKISVFTRGENVPIQS